MSLRTWIGLGLVLGFLLWFLSGCVSIHIVPEGLPIPEAPPLHFDAAGPVCLSEQDGNLLRQYFDKLGAFQEAWERLRNVR